MNVNRAEVDRRTALALTAIRRALDDDGDNPSVQLFVEHHLEEIEASYWQQHASTPCPSSAQVLDLLVLRSHWGEESEDGLDTFDFTLPGDATNYVLAVSFGEAGDVEDISMES